jgi:hypothetical protein
MIKQPKSPPTTKLFSFLTLQVATPSAVYRAAVFPLPFLPISSFLWSALGRVVHIYYGCVAAVLSLTFWFWLLPPVQWLTSPRKRGTIAQATGQLAWLSPKLPAHCELWSRPSCQWNWIGQRFPQPSTSLCTAQWPCDLSEPASAASGCSRYIRHSPHTVTFPILCAGQGCLLNVV